MTTVNVNITGSSERIKNAEIVSAIKFYWTILLNHISDKKSLPGVINIILDLKDIDGCEGYIERRGNNFFNMEIGAELSKRKTLIAIAHEMTHLKQYMDGEFNCDMLGGYWLGKRIENNVHYYDTPWEIEAFGRELGLYYRFLDFKKANKIKF